MIRTIETPGQQKRRLTMKHPIKLTALLYLKEALLKERYELCPEIINVAKEFEQRIGTQTLGNKPASGTEIIKALGPLHVETGFPILYTSADSVFQLACHEDVVAVEVLYDYCRIARELCVAPDNVQRVIARPFIGEPGSFKRTEARQDYAIDPPEDTLLDLLSDFLLVSGVGINDVPLCQFVVYVYIAAVFRNRSYNTAILDLR